MPKPSAFAKQVQAQVEARLEEARYHSRVHMMDMVTVTLGRMGWGEKRLNDFDKKLAEVWTEYAKLTLDDVKSDDDLTYTKACLDRELKHYVGKRFVPYEERHK